MKFDGIHRPRHVVESHPVRGAWIEIFFDERVYNVFGSHPVRGAWIEMPERPTYPMRYKSHPVRGAWIEIRREDIWRRD